MSPHVLLVEDDPDTSALYQRIFRMKDFEVSSAIDHLGALDLLEQKDIDLAIIDYQLPKLNGAELCKLIKQNAATAHIPVIVLTIESTDEIEARCIAAGTDAFFAKPPVFDDILAQAKLLIGRTKE